MHGFYKDCLVKAINNLQFCYQASLHNFWCLAQTVSIESVGFAIKTETMIVFVQDKRYVMNGARWSILSMWIGYILGEGW